MIVLRDDTGIGGSVTCHTTGVERTQCQLCTWLTDSLGSDHTNSLTLLDHTTGSQVTAVTLHADTLLRLTGEHGTDLDSLDVSLLDGLGDGLSDLLTSLDNDFTVLRVDNIMDRHTAEDTL